MASDELKKRFDELERLAYGAGLKPYDIHYFEVPADIINQVASYGLPVRYSHWSFGRSYENQKNQSEMGFSKIYELIINNNPSYAFLDNRNTNTDNLLICAHCYLPGTYVQTCDGVKVIESVQEGDVVFTHIGNKQAVSPTSRRYDGEVITLQAGSYSFTQTLDHQLYVIKINSTNRKTFKSRQSSCAQTDNGGHEPEWVEAGDIKSGDYLVVNKPKIGLDKLKIFDVPVEYTDAESNVLISVDADFGELVGLYLSNERIGSTGQMEFCFNEESNINENLSDIHISDFLHKKLHFPSGEKGLPWNWLHDTSVEFLRGVLIGYLRGSGINSQSDTVEYTSMSSILAMQIQQIGMLMGIYFGISPSHDNFNNKNLSFNGVASDIYDNKARLMLGIPEREINHNWSDVVESDDAFYVKVKSTSIADYSGTVYCLNVQEDHSFTLVNGIVTHNCIGHSDFFANNIMFKQANESDMVQVAKLHADNINDFRKEYGDDEVDEWLDIALALERHIDPHKGRRRTRYPNRHTEYQERKPDPWEDFIVDPPNKRPLIKKVVKNSHIPPKSEKDILWFLAEYSNMENWQKRIFEIVRRESYYFFPQFVTKILNEGWASYWHAELMAQYALGNDNEYGVNNIENPLTPEEHLDFVSSHAKVVQPGIKIPLKVPVVVNGVPTGEKVWNPHIAQNPHLFNAATRINPYYVGFRILRDIKERWDRYYDDGHMEDSWGNKIPVTINGLQKILEVRAEEDDVSFMRKYLTDELANDLNLFAFGNTESYNDNYGIQEDLLSDQCADSVQRQDTENKTIEVRSKEAADIVNVYAKSTSNYGVPMIVVRRIDSDGLLRLEHITSDNVNVDIKYAKHVLNYIQKAWGHPVELIRKSKERGITWILAMDGNKLVVDTMPTTYPESIE